MLGPLPYTKEYSSAYIVKSIEIAAYANVHPGIIIIIVHLGAHTNSIKVMSPKLHSDVNLFYCLSV